MPDAVRSGIGWERQGESCLPCGGQLLLQVRCKHRGEGPCPACLDCSATLPMRILGKEGGFLAYRPPCNKLMLQCVGIAQLHVS